MPKITDIMPAVFARYAGETAEMFDDNFPQAKFFSDKWTPKKCFSKVGYDNSNCYRRHAMEYELQYRGNGVVFTSDKPYAALHNEADSFRQNVGAVSQTAGDADTVSGRIPGR